jgi:hypothetical protein
MIIEPTCHYNEQEINQYNPQNDGAQMRLETQIRPYQLMDEITSASTHTCTCLHDQHLYSLKQSDSRGNKVQRRMRKRWVQRRISSCAYAGSEIERCVDLFFLPWLTSCLRTGIGRCVDLFFPWANRSVLAEKLRNRLARSFWIYTWGRLHGQNKQANERLLLSLCCSSPRSCQKPKRSPPQYVSRLL